MRSPEMSSRRLDGPLLDGGSSEIRGVATENLTAYESYLRGLEQQAIFSHGSLPLAENYFKNRDRAGSAVY